MHRITTDFIQQLRPADAWDPDLQRSSANKWLIILLNRCFDDSTSWMPRDGMRK